MAGMKFAYKEFPAGSSEAFPYRKSTFRPVIPVIIEYNGRKVGYEALLDTGADYNIFPSVIGEIIGIDIAKGRKDTFGGIGGGGFTAYFHEITLYVGGWPTKIFCGFSPDIPEGASYGVLGHIGFFDHFTTRFETDKREVELKQIKH